MRWVVLGADLLFACFGVWLLLTAYRVVGKPPGVDEKYDAALARQGTNYKTIGWCVLFSAIIGYRPDCCCTFQEQLLITPPA